MSRLNKMCPVAKDVGLEANKYAKFVIGSATNGWAVTDCDYLCDGSNDEVEINTALMALPAMGGQIVLLDGKYNISAKISVTKSNVSIGGAGNATILKRSWIATNANDQGIITLENGTNNCTISNLCFDGEYPGGDGVGNVGVALVTSSYNLIENCTFVNHNQGIHAISSSYNIYAKNVFRTIGNHGLCIEYGFNNTISNNITKNCWHGISIYNSNYNNTVGNSVFDSGRDGILLSGGTNGNSVLCNTVVLSGGTPADYSETQFTIYVYGTGNSNALVAGNNTPGKAVAIGGGTGNTLINNKWSAANCGVVNPGSLTVTAADVSAGKVTKTITGFVTTGMIAHMVSATGVPVALTVEKFTASGGNTTIEFNTTTLTAGQIIYYLLW